MNCFFCKGDQTEGTTTHTADFGKCVIVVRNVPCRKCEQCGETVYTGTVVKQLEKIVDSLKNSLTEIAVVNYSDKVA